jgi:DNA polymerase-1
LFPNVRAFHDSFWKSDKQQRGYNETYYGRRRKLHKLGARADNRARAGLMRFLINGDIQGTGGDVLKIGMVNCWEVVKQFPGLCYMVMCVHDEIIFEVADFMLAEIIQKLVDAMHDIPFPLPPEVDVEVGKNWFDIKSYALQGE